MVGKVNLPPDAEKRKDVKGAAIGGPGLTALDEERAASMADEGGVSGSAVEGESSEGESKKKKKEKEEEPARSPVRRRGR
jgi:hypothetical protein